MGNLLVTLLRILVIGIRLLLLFFSVVGWIVFTVGFVHLDKKVHKYYNPNTFIFGPDYAEKFLGLANVLFAPMWLFMASGLVVYISLALHIIISHQNIRHILHSILMFFNVFYMFGGSGSLIVALLFYTPKTADTLQGLVHLDHPSIKIVLCGVSLSVGMYWISTWLWPLFELRRRRRTAFAYQPIPQDDDVGIAGSHVQGGYGYGSGRFSHSVTKELCQQVSQEYGEYD